MLLLSEALCSSTTNSATELRPKGLGGLSEQAGQSDLVRDQLASNLIYCNMPAIVEELTPSIIDGALKLSSCSRAYSSYYFISWPYILSGQHGPCLQKGKGHTHPHWQPAALWRWWFLFRYCQFQWQKRHKLQAIARIFRTSRRKPALIAHPGDK